MLHIGLNKFVLVQQCIIIDIIKLMQRMKISNVVMGICKSKNIHYNGQDKNNKRTINDLQNTTHKTKY